MSMLHTAADLVLHLDRHLIELLTLYGAWIYAILFTLIFCETGLVVTTAEHGWVHWRSLYVDDPEGNAVELVCYDASVVEKTS